ncbi:MAG TPA: hypothetical protein VHW23_34835 [Kofleriaceae bacterium]|nr:hypothetical protein [Kofleriaceae bacterium]
MNARIAACAADPRVIAGTVSVDICIGADVFLREDFGGNGRTCATCHRVDNNFTIDPAFISRLPASDPLFVAEFNPALAGLEISAQVRAKGLILENVDGTDPDPRTHFVLRSVPHNFSMGTSVTPPPNDTSKPLERTGWSGDGAPGDGTLRDFLTGAITQHYTRTLARAPGTDFRLADDGELDRVELFMRQLGRTNDLTLASVVMSDTAAEVGRTTFLTAGCNACHGNAGANASFGGGGNRNFNTGVESSRNADLAAFPHDGGLGRDPVTADGSFGNGTFNTPPLVEAADTGPFFHTATTVSGAPSHNAAVASSIEEAVAFYTTPAFNNSPSGRLAPISLTADQIDAIGRFLRGINAAFNAALAIKRLDASSALVARFPGTRVDIQRGELRLANVEVRDAIRVLRGVPNLDTMSVTELLAAAALIDTARLADVPLVRALTICIARGLVADASTKIGTNLTFQIGDGTVMF